MDAAGSGLCSLAKFDATGVDCDDRIDGVRLHVFTAP